MFLLIAACVEVPAPVPDEGAPPEWDAAGPALACNEGASAALYEAALADAAIDREDVGFSEATWNQMGDLVRGPFQLSMFEPVHHAPEYAACFARQVASDLDHALAAAHPAASALASAALADMPLDGEPLHAPDTTFADALARVTESAGGGEASSRADEVPADLGEALVPVMVALAEAIDARHAMDAAAEALGKPRKLWNAAPGYVISGLPALPSPNDADEVTAYAEWFTGGSGPRALALPARRLAFAIEDADLSRFAGGETAFSFATEAGEIRISPASDDVHDDAGIPVLFHLDLGGNDRYLGGAGANLDEDNPVSISVDLGGDDAYGYTEEPHEGDVAGVLPSDADGREVYYLYEASGSETGRQGSGRYGIGMLFDRGGGVDGYASLRMSQGFGAMGVGLLHDDGGNDTYAAEAGAQGSGVWGLGLLLDGGGNDSYLSWAYAQGFGYAGSLGALVDGAGEDVYRADPGNAFGGVTLYASPQLAGGEGNSSFCQGAGFGFRGDSYGQWYSGGLGILRDAAGDDAYTAGVFSEGTGYWEGTGLLSDGGGDDSYDALYYTQGGAAHYATGLLMDQGGNDAYNQTFDSYYVQTGSGHDFSLGMFVDDAGDDVYGFGGLAIGASNCQGVGIFVDRDGSDVYDARSNYAMGLGNHSGECESRTRWVSIGIFLDSGGDADTYAWPEGDARAPADGGTFGISWNGTSDEHGGAVDGDGEAGF